MSIKARTGLSRQLPLGSVLAAVLMACGASVDAPSTSAMEATTASTTAAAATSTTVTELTLSGADILAPGIYSPSENPLDPGTYTVDTAGVPITFTMLEGWTLQNEAQVGAVWQPGQDIFGLISAIRFHGEVFSDPCGGDPPVAIELTARGLIDWLAANPVLESSPVEEFSVGGADGFRIEVTTGADSVCPDPRMALLVLPVVGDYHLLPQMTAEFMSVEVGDVVLLLGVEADNPSWEATEAAADSFFESLIIGS